MTIPEFSDGGDTHQSTLGASERVKRPLPERSSPLRGAAHAFRSAHGDAQSGARDETTHARNTAKSTVEAAVETAYRVYDDYVSWGRQMASQQTATRDWRTPMGPKTLDPQAAANQWISMWQELARAWFGALSPLLPSAPGLMPFMPDPAAINSMFAPSRPGPAAAVATAAGLDFELESRQGARVSLHLVQRPASGQLRAQLHREEGEGRLALVFDAARIQIKIGDEHPPGTYSGIVRDAAGQQLGMLTIELFARILV